MQGDLTSKAYGLVFGDSTFSTMIMATYPVTDEKSGKDIIKTLNTIVYDTTKVIVPFETAKFSFDENKSKFKFLMFNANLFIYTIDGKDNGGNSDAPFLLVTQVPMDNTMTLKSISDMFIASSQKYGLENPVVKNSSTDKINGYETYKSQVYGEMNGAKTLFYTVVISNSDVAIAIQAIAKNDFETNIEEFDKLINTIKMK